MSGRVGGGESAEKLNDLAVAAGSELAIGGFPPRLPLVTAFPVAPALSLLSAF